jgi:fumarate hydratase subunit beta
LFRIGGIVTKHVKTPLDDATVESLKAGDLVLISGVLYTARDAAHKKLVELINKGEELPLELQGQVIYYAGPTPSKPGRPIGSAGPTTSYRMDSYAPLLIEKGLRGMIGKGERSEPVVEAMKRHGAVYFAATGGAGVLIARSVQSAEVVAYPELGPEAIRRLEVKDFPAIVAQDKHGGNLYKEGRRHYFVG